MNTELDPHHPLGPSDAQIARMRTNVHATIATDHTRTRRHRGWTIGGTLGLLVILAGGTSVAMAAGVLQTPPWLTAAPTPTPTATHEPVTVTTPTPTTTPTATPTAPTAPAAFNLPCDQQFDPAVLASVGAGLKLQAPSGAGVAPPTGHGIEAGNLSLLSNGGPPMAASTIAAAQAGLYTCSWWNGTSTVRGVTLSVLPGASRAFPMVKASWAQDKDYETLQIPQFAVGDDSISACYERDSLYGCGTDFVDGDLVIAVQVFHGASAPTPEQYASDLKALAESVSNRISATGTVPQAAPVAPSSWTGTSDCSRIAHALAPQSPGIKLEYGQLDATDNYTPLFDQALSIGGFACDSIGSGPDVAVVPGAARWAWAAPYSSAVTVTQLSTDGLPGVEKARYACLASVCWTDGVIDGAIVTIVGPSQSAVPNKEWALTALGAMAAE